MELKDKQLGLMRYRVMAALAKGALDAGNSALAAEYSSCANLFRSEILDAIGGLEDECVRDVLVSRYVYGMKWEAIAERMHFSRRWVLKLHQKGLMQL